MTELQEARLLGRAIRSRWNIPEAEKANVMDSLLHLATNGAEESTRIAAAKAIIAAEAQNQKDEHAQADALRRKLLELAIEYGSGLPADGKDGERKIGHHSATSGHDRETE